MKNVKPEKTKTSVLLSIILLFSAIVSFGQTLENKKTVGVCNVAEKNLPIEVESSEKTQTIAYPNLKKAFEAINNGIHQGKIEIEICFDSEEKETAVLNSQNMSSANYISVTIRPLKDNLRIYSQQGLLALIALEGMDEVMIDGDNPNTEGENIDLTLEGWGGRSIVAIQTRQYLKGQKIFRDSAVGNTLRNLNIFGKATPSFGVAIGGFNPGSSGKKNNKNLIENCVFQNVRVGVFSSGESPDKPNEKNIVRGNNFTGKETERIKLVAIQMEFENNAEITKNIIGGVSSVTGERENVGGIVLGSNKTEKGKYHPESGSVSNTLIAENKIYDIVGGEQQSAVGILICGNGFGKNTLQNNMIDRVWTSAKKEKISAGIFINGDYKTQTDIFVNSVSISNESGSDKNFAIAANGESFFDLQNNFITMIKGKGEGKLYALGLERGRFDTFFSDKNIFCPNNESKPAFRLGLFDDENYLEFKGLEEWQKVSKKDLGSRIIYQNSIKPCK